MINLLDDLQKLVKDANSLVTFTKNSNLEKLVVTCTRDIQQKYLGDVLNMLFSYINIDNAVGVWLDYIGCRFNFCRPTTSILDTDILGFTGTNAQSFNSAPFWNESDIVAVSDDVYRGFIKVFASHLLSSGSKIDLENALKLIYADVKYDDIAINTVDITVTTTTVTDLILIAIASGLFKVNTGINLRRVYKKETSTSTPVIIYGA